MPTALADRLRARGFMLPSYDGRGLVNVAATVLDLLGALEPADPPPLADLDPALRDGVRTVVVILADGLGYGQLQRATEDGDMPFLSTILARAERREGAQLLDCTTVFPSTTAAAIVTMQTASTPQEHGNVAYFTWLEEFSRVTQMLRWGRADQRRGSYFDDGRLDPEAFARRISVYERLRDVGTRSYLIEPEFFRTGAIDRMYSKAAEFVGISLASTMGVRLRQLLEAKPWGNETAYVYAYWEGVDYIAHRLGPRGPEHAAEAAALDLSLRRALGHRDRGETLVLFTADHGHAATEHEAFLDLHDDAELVSLLKHPLAGEPRAAFFHTDRAADVVAHLERRYPGAFFTFSRDEALDAGLFGGRGDPALLRRRVGEVVGLLDGTRGASLVRVEGQVLRQRGAHGGMTPDEMRIPVLAWRC